MSKMKLTKRACDISMRIVPCGGGWTDVHLDIGKDRLSFTITYAYGHSFNDFLKILYHLHPDNIGSEHAWELVEYKVGVYGEGDNKAKIVKIVDNDQEAGEARVLHDIPWKAEFCWEEEQEARSIWTIERTPDESTDFMLSIHIEIQRDDKKIYDYVVPYKDLCYAVAKAYTDTLKRHGFYGYHHATYTQDINMRYLLFLKSIALDYDEAREVIYHDEDGRGESSDFIKELALLLFDM